MLARQEEIAYGFRREKVPDSLIKLPEFSYDPAAKEDFLADFRLMCKAIDGEYLLTNELRRISDGMRVDGQHPPKHTTTSINVFSPTHDRRREAYAITGDDPYAKVEGSRYTSPHSADFAPAWRGGAVQRDPTRQTPHTTHPDFRSHLAFGTPPSQPHVTPGAHVPQTPTPASAPTAPPGPFSERTAPYSASVASHQSSNTLNSQGFGPPPPTEQHLQRARITMRQAPQGLPMPYTGPPGPPVPFVRPPEAVEEDAASIVSMQTAATGSWSHPSDPSESEGEPAEVKYPDNPPPGGGEGSSLQHDTARTIADSHAFENGQLRMQLLEQQRAHQEQMNRLERMMQTMHDNMNRTKQEHQASLAQVHDSSTYVNRGVEDWVVQERLERDFRSEYGFWWVSEQRWENPAETMLRSRVYLYLKRRLPSELHRGTIENDVRTVWINIVRINTSMAADQVVLHMRSLLKMHKGTKPMLTWLNDIYHKVEQLEALNKPVDHFLIRTLITESLEGDKRYELVLIDINKNPQWNMADMKARLTAAAAIRNDLVPDAKYARKKRQKEQKAVRKALQKKQGDQPEGNKALKAQLAHGKPTDRPTGKGDMPAEGDKVDRQRRDRLRNELCKLYLIGKCNRGTSCLRQHMTLDEVKAELDGRKRSAPAKGAGNKSDKQLRFVATSDPPPKQGLNGGVCYSWRDDGECPHGDACKFKHIARMLRALPAFTELDLGDLITIDGNDPTFVDLIGAVGTITSVIPSKTKGGTPRYGVKLNLPIALLDGNARALVARAEATGLPRSSLLRVAGAHSARVTSKFKSFKAQRTIGQNPYSANAICDGGSNVMLSSVRELFANLTACSPDEERVAGIADIGVTPTHKGKVTIKLGAFSQRHEGLFVPSPSIFTIVPGSWFDDGDWSYACQNRTLFIFKQVDSESVCCGRFPRRIMLRDEHAYGQDFIHSLIPGGGRQRLHSLYPLPDSVFVWHKTNKVNVVTRKESASPIKLKAPTLEEEKFSPKPSFGAEILPVNPDPVPQAIYVWSDHLRHDGGERAHSIIKGIKELHDFHHLSGHRSANHTALLHAWIFGRTHSKAVRLNQRRCDSCAVAKSARDALASDRLVKVEPGEALAGDSIIGMPRSHSGYENVGHWHDISSNFGAIVMSKSKAFGPHFCRFYEKMYLLTGKYAAHLYIDRGELATKQLTDAAFGRGTTIVKNIADSHTNTTIEVRHKVLNEMANAMLHRGGANSACWEYAYPSANYAINISPSVRELARVGFPRKGKQRPLTPFEKVVAKGEYIDIKRLWRNLQGIFELCTAHLDGGVKGHAPRGYQAINLGIIPDEDLSSTSFGFYVLRLDDKKVYRARTVKNFTGVFPWRPAPRKALPEPDDPDEECESDCSPSGGESESKGEKSQSETENERKHKSERPMAPKERMKKRERFLPGTEVMTTEGPAVVVTRYPDGDYAITWDGNSGPQEVYTVRPEDIWLSAEWPDHDYTRDGKRVTPEAEATTTADGPRGRLKGFQAAPDPKQTEADCPITPGQGGPALDAPAGRTRSRGKALSARQLSNAPAGYRIFDQAYPNGVRTMQHCRSRLVPSVIGARAMKAKSKPPPIWPENLPIKITREMLRKMRACDVSPVLPQHFHQTLHSPLREECERGEMEELQDCLNREVWGRPEPRQESDIVIPLMWVYTVKEKNGFYQRVRSRITLMGNRERNVLAKLDAYAPVAQMVTSRLLIAMHLHQRNVRFRKIDVKNAYINEDMRRLVRVRLPPGYTWYALPSGGWSLTRLEPGEKQPDVCMVLLKALYGGMECGRIFWEAWIDWHLDYGFQIIHEERCYLALFGPKGTFIKMAFHVDDSLVATCGEPLYQEYLTAVSKKFDVKEEGLASHLGIDYQHDPEEGIMRMSQAKQVEKLLATFGMTDCKPADTPTLSGPMPCEEDCATADATGFDMQALVGHLQWLYQCTRPDIGQPLKILSRFTVHFGQKHVQFAKHVMRYLKGTMHQPLEYRAGFPLYFQVFTDASHASCVDTRRSVLSVMFKLGGMLVFWKNFFSAIVSHSSCESELFALDMGVTNGQCLRYLLEAMDGPIQGNIQVFVDNQGTIDIASNPVQSGRNLHVHARYFYVRDLVYGEEFVIVPLPSHLQIADIGCSYKGSHNFHTLLKYTINTARIIHDVNRNPAWELLESCGETTPRE